MGFTHHDAAKALHLGITTVSNYSLGKRCDTDHEVEVPYPVLLACAAIENGLVPIN